VVAYNSSGAVMSLLYLFKYIQAPTVFGAFNLPLTPERELGPPMRKSSPSFGEDAGGKHEENRNKYYL